MRPRFIVFISVVILMILAVLIWPRPVRVHTNVDQLQTTARLPNEGDANSTSQGSPHATTSAVTSSVNSEASVSNKVGVPDVINGFIESNNKPIVFFGQVIDQDSNALPGVEINASVEQLTMPEPSFQEPIGSKYISIVRVTDASGRFEISGLRGDGFGIGLTKNGYKPSHKCLRSITAAARWTKP
jgi:hypothetical protein